MSSEGGDGARTLTEDELDELATRAGQALRAPAPVHGPEGVIRAARRRQVVRAVSIAGVLAALIGGGAVAVLAFSNQQAAPADSTPTSTLAGTTAPQPIVPATSAPAQATTTVPSVAPVASAAVTDTTTPHPFSEFELGGRLDLDRWFSLSLTGDGASVPSRCLPDNPNQCTIELIDARTLQPAGSVTCPNLWIDGEPAIDVAAVPAFLARYPGGSTSGSGAGWCGAPIGERVAVVGNRNPDAAQTTSVFDTTTGEELWRHEGPGLLALSPVGDVVAGSDASGAQVVLDALTGEQIGALPQSPSGWFIHFDPTGRFMLSANHLDVVDVSTGTIVYQAEAYWGLFDRSSAMLVAVGVDEIALVDTATWTERWSIPYRGTGYSLGPNPYRFGGFSPDGSILAIGSPAVLIDTATGAHIATLDDVCGTAAGPNQPDPYEWLPDGRTLLFQCLTTEGSTPAWLQLVTLGAS